MSSNPDETTPETEEVILANQFPPTRRTVPFDMGLNEFEPAECEYTRSTVVYRCAALNTEEEAHAKARKFLGEDYGTTKAFRTARYWVFYIES